MSRFTGSYYWGVPNVNRSRIPVRTLGTIQEGGQPGGFNMYNTSTIIQIPTNTQTTTPAVPTSTQTTLPINTQTTLPTSTTTQTTTPQVPVSNVITLPNILQTTTTHTPKYIANNYYSSRNNDRSNPRRKQYQKPWK